MATKLHVVVLRRTPKAKSVREAIPSRRREEKQELSEEKGQNVEHTYKAEQVYKTLHVNSKRINKIVPQSFSTPQQALWPICTSINKPHQTFRETSRSYGFGTSTHSTALQRQCTIEKNLADLCPWRLHRPSTARPPGAEREQVSTSVPCPILRRPSYVCTVRHVGTRNTTSYTV